MISVSRTNASFVPISTVTFDTAGLPVGFQEKRHALAGVDSHLQLGFQPGFGGKSARWHGGDMERHGGHKRSGHFDGRLAANQHDRRRQFIRHNLLPYDSGAFAAIHTARQQWFDRCGFDDLL